MDAFQSFSFVLTVFALLLSVVTLMQSNTNSAELFFIRGRIKELEIQLSRKQAIRDFPRKRGKYKNNSPWISCISAVGFDANE